MATGTRTTVQGTVCPPCKEGHVLVFASGPVSKNWRSVLALLMLLTCARTHMFERNESDFRRTEFSDGTTLLHLSQRLIQQCTVRHVEVKPR
jgi:hypothetical protein